MSSLNALPPAEGRSTSRTPADSPATPASIAPSPASVAVRHHRAPAAPRVFHGLWPGSPAAEPGADARDTRAPTRPASAPSSRSRPAVLPPPSASAALPPSEAARAGSPQRSARAVESVRPATPRQPQPDFVRPAAAPVGFSCCPAWMAWRYSWTAFWCSASVAENWCSRTPGLATKNK